MRFSSAPRLHASLAALLLFAFFIQVTIQITSAAPQAKVLKAKPVIADAKRIFNSETDAEFVFRMPFQISRPGGTVGVLLSGESGYHLRLDLRATTLQLVEVRGAKETRLQSARVLLAAKNTLLVVRRGSLLRAALNGRVLLQAKTSASPINRIAVIDRAAELKLLEEPRLQPTEEIFLTDDFMTAPDAPSHWRAVAGTWHVAGADRPQDAADPFKFVGFTSQKLNEAVALNADTRWFWDDYQTDISARVLDESAAFGVVFAYRSPQDFYAFSWSGAKVPGGGQMKLWRRVGSKTEVLATRPVAAQAGQWYRIAVSTFGTQIAAYVDENKVLSATNANLTGGQVGLFAAGEAGAEFDDVAVQSVTSTTLAAAPMGDSDAAWQERTFATDPFMAAWGNAASEWEKGKSGDSYWYRGHYFGALDVHLGASLFAKDSPSRLQRVLLLGEDGGAQQGYALDFTDEKLSLSKAGTKIAGAALPNSNLKIKIRGGGVLVFDGDGKRLISYNDRAPVGSGRVGLSFASPVAAETIARAVEVESPNALEYRFDSAPVDWQVESGMWQSTTRWACVPNWNFFGGKGVKDESVAAGDPLATVWNKRGFAGDQWIEAFVAPSEGTSDWMHFAYPVNLNITFGATAEKLNSGYTLVYRAQDETTLLYRGGKVVASSKELVVPDFRSNPMEVYERLTETWQHLQILRQDGRIRVWAEVPGPAGKNLERRLLLDYTDPQPLRGDRLALWTWGINGMSVAKLRVSAQKINAPSASFLNAATSTPRVASTPQLQRFVNPINGGAFRIELGKNQRPQGVPGLVEFDYRSTPDAALALYAVVGGQLFRADFLGKVTSDGDAVPIGSMRRSTAKPMMHAAFPLRQALREYFPSGELPRLEQLFLANLSRAPEQIGGLAVNPKGAVFEMSGLSIAENSGSWAGGSRRAGSSVDTTPPLPPRITTSNGEDRIETFESGTGGWQRMGGEQGATLWRDMSTAASGKASLRLYHRKLAGPFGAIIRDKPFDARRFPIITFSYRVNPAIKTTLFCEINGNTYEIAFTDNDRTFPQIGTIANVQKDNQWHQAEVDLLGAVQGANAGTTVVTKLFFADSGITNTIQDVAWNIDDFRLVPALSSGSGSTLRWTADDASGIEGYSWVMDNAPDTLPDEMIETQNEIPVAVGATYLHVRARDKAGNWGAPAHFRFAPLQLPDASTPVAAELAEKNLSEPAAEIRLQNAAQLDVESLQLKVVAGGKSKEYSVLADSENSNFSFDASAGVLRWSDAAFAQSSDTKSYPLAIEFGANDLSGKNIVREKWQAMVDPALDKAAPAAPYVSYIPANRLVRSDFDQPGEASFGDAGIRRSIWLTRDASTAATGQGSGRVVNLLANDFFSAFLKKNPYSVSRYPRLEFDYRFQIPDESMFRRRRRNPNATSSNFSARPPYNMNLVAIVNGDMQIIKFVGGPNAYPTFTQNQIGEIEDGKADGEWHHASLDLGALLKKRYPNAPRFFADYVGTWATGPRGYENPQGASLWLDNITFFSTAASSAAFEWRAPEDGNGISGYSYAIDQNPETVPAEKINTVGLHAEAKNLKPGTWYFHLRARDGAGNWSTPSHKKFELTSN